MDNWKQENWQTQHNSAQHKFRITKSNFWSLFNLTHPIPRLPLPSQSASPARSSHAGSNLLVSPCLAWSRNPCPFQSCTGREGPARCTVPSGFGGHPGQTGRLAAIGGGRAAIGGGRRLGEGDDWGRGGGDWGRGAVIGGDWQWTFPLTRWVKGGLLWKLIFGAIYKIGWTIYKIGWTIYK